MIVSSLPLSVLATLPCNAKPLVFTFDLELLDRYYAISSSLNLSSSGTCIYLDKSAEQGFGFTSLCPWETEEINDTVIEDNE